MTALLLLAAFLAGFYAGVGAMCFFQVASRDAPRP